MAVSHRPDGSTMPYLDEGGAPIPIKSWGEQYRRRFEDAGLA